MARHARRIVKTEPITPAGRTGGDSNLAQTRPVVLAAHGLPARWATRERFVILETGFGHGTHFLLTWQAWRDDPQRCERLVFIGVESHPPSQADLQHVPRDEAVTALAAELTAAWPPLTPNLHTLDFEGGRVQLVLAWGDVRALLQEIVAHVDAFFLDGNTLRIGEAAWSHGIFKSIARLAAPGATAAIDSGTREVHAGLLSAGFEVERAPRLGSPSDMTLARHAPRHVPASPPGGLHRHEGARAAVVVGAGLAGCAAAWALAREGWQVTVVDRAEAPASGASGNAIGLVHGVVHGDDGPHARAHRAAALRAAQVLAPWVASGRVRGKLDGLLRLDRSEASDPRTLSAERARAAAFASGHAEGLDRDRARECSALPVATGGWWFPQGGWVVPADVARAMLDDSGARFIGGFDVDRIERKDGHWQVHGHPCDGLAARMLEAPVLVLATAEHLPGKLDAPLAQALGPLAAVRGQLSALRVDERPGSGLAPRVPVSGDGYLAPPLEGLLWFGATSDDGDRYPALRIADHRRNLGRLAALAGMPTLAGLDEATLAAMPGRVAWRAVAPDRLPWVGALPDLTACHRAIEGRHRIDAPRLVPRLRDAAGGLHVIGAFGSRGIGWAALCGELLASWITGAPCPIEADLRDALDPARGWLRARRREAQAAPRIDS